MNVDLLSETLRRLQQQFDAHAKQGNIIAYLTEQPILDLEELVKNISLPGCRWWNVVGESVYLKPDPSKKAQILDRLKQSQGFTHPLFDDRGMLQVLNEDGQPIPIDHGIIRKLSLTWESPDHLDETFCTLAKAAGSVLADLPPSSLSLIPAETLETSSHELRWGFTVFDLAWNKPLGSPLITDFCISNCSADSNLKLPSWYWRVDDLCLASVYAIDILLHDIGKVDQPAETKPETAIGDDEARHSPDFRSVYWFGTQYTFTTNQANCIKILWERWEKNIPDADDQDLLEQLGGGNRLRDVFRLTKDGQTTQHPAWGAMIVRGKRKGTHRLMKPN